jgi:hypothetical protein
MVKKISTLARSRFSSIVNFWSFILIRRYAFTTELALNAAFPAQVTIPPSPGQVMSCMFYSIRNPLCGLSNSIVVLQTAARSFLEATLKTVNSGSPVSFPETRDEAAKLFSGIKPSPDHMHWSVNRVYLFNSLRSLFLTAPRFEYNFLFVLAAGGSHLFILVTSLCD